MTVLFITNIPSPYRVKFFNALGKYVNLTVLFEGMRSNKLHFNWDDAKIQNFHAIYLANYINEKKIEKKIFQYLTQEYDYIFATNYGYITEFAAIIYMQWKKIPYLLEIDGALLPEKENYFKYWIKKRVISKAKGWFSPSLDTDNFLCHYNADKGKIVRYPFTSLVSQDIYPTISSATEKKLLRQMLHLESKWIVLAVGQFIPRKGFDVLMQAACLLSKEIGFYFIGGVPTKEYMNFIRINKLTNIYFRGYQSSDDLKKYYRAADLFCLPTREDIWGLVINEAMACGLPVVTTTRCAAGKELLSKGILVEPNNSIALANAIRSCIYDETKRDKIAEENLCIIRQYTIEKMVEAHCKFMGV